MKITVSYWVAFEVDVPSEDFYTVYNSDMEHLNKGDEYARLAYENSEAIRKFIAIEEGEGEITGVYNPTVLLPDGTFEWANDDDMEAYWES